MPSYQVSNSGMVANQFREMMEQARKEGRLKVAHLAANWIMTELEETPMEFGESREEHPEIGIQMRIGFARPIAVRHGFHEATNAVFIRSFSWMSPI